MRNYISLLLFLAAFALSSHSSLLSREGSCITNYQICSPLGANSIAAPQIGDPSLQNLYADLISSSLPSSDPKVLPPIQPQSSSGPSLCCSQYQQCMTLNHLSIPFCYSRFTTNFFLPDGSYGTVISGVYTSSSGVTANLLTGEYRFENGTTGNIYTGNEAARPNTATLAIPSQFTGTGVGTVVPASELGKGATTYTTIISEEGGGVKTQTVTVATEMSRQNTPGTTETVSGYGPRTGVESVTVTTSLIVHSTVEEPAPGQTSNAASTVPGTDTVSVPDNTAGSAGPTQLSDAGHTSLAEKGTCQAALYVCLCVATSILAGLF